MVDRSVRLLVAFALLVTACEGAAAPGPPSPPTANKALELLWADYTALHTRVHEENTEWVGQHLEQLLSGEMRAMIDAAVGASVSGVRHRPMGAAISAERVRHRILGESVLVRRDRIRRSRLRAVRRLDDDHALLVIDDSGGRTADLPVVREAGEWRFAPSSHLVVRPDELYPLPARAAAGPSRSHHTADALAAALVAALNGGTGWSMVDLLDAASHASIQNALLDAGAAGSEIDVVRVLDRAGRGLRRDHGTARVRSITLRSTDRARIAVEFADGIFEDFTAVRDADGWHLHLAL